MPKLPWFVVLAAVAACVAVAPSARSGDLPGTSMRPAIAPSEDAAVLLGKRLFFDPRLSADRNTSCATCHRPERAFTDDRPAAVGAFGRRGTRNTPSLIGVGERSTLTWDGRGKDLAHQVLVPLTHPAEMGGASLDEVIAAIAGDDGYVQAFARSFGSARIDAASIGRALVAYVATFRPGASPIDRYLQGKPEALSRAARRGLTLFTGAAGCSECHGVSGGEAFTDGRFHRTGVGLTPVLPRLAEVVQRALAIPAERLDHAVAEDGAIAALGRFLVSKNPKDIGAYRTPSLRNVAVTSPYMHDGSIATLAEAVDAEIYYRTVATGKPLILTPTERADLVAFLESFTEDRFLPVRPDPSTQP